eukprot:CAMPEP_0198698830 /NCGR_PEP_ID=MMETSP1468-20131203/344103_1 /TAXON_ID=1461545 /ORGANISM="Mantoniella sp, Strain CCMP1436" /LENGTH=41 /DNA_ID= /DNA_START= /DNA_END= /DNA_ORIENTATION=
MVSAPEDPLKVQPNPTPRQPRLFLFKPNPRGGKLCEIDKTP